MQYFPFFCLYDEFFLFSKYFLTSCIESETQWVKLSDVENSFEGVVDLIVKNNVSTFVLSFWEQSVYLMKKKTHSLRQLAAVAEQYLAGKNKKLSSRDFNLKKSACALRPTVKNADASSATRKGLKYFNCRKLGLIKSRCYLRVQGRGGRNFCYEYKEFGHAFTQCEKKLLSSCVGLRWK